MVNQVFKCSDAPTLTKSMHIALADLGLTKLFMIYPGKERYRFHEKIEAIPLTECVKLKDTEPELGG